MSKITESVIEKFTVEILDKHGYRYIYAPSIAPVLPACDLACAKRSAAGRRTGRQR